jgi:hypothetical protein
VTRARTSTSREPAVWPTYSKVTGSACGLTAATVTSGGGIPPIGPCPPPLPPFSLPFEGLQAATTKAVDTMTRCLKLMRNLDFARRGEGRDSNAPYDDECCSCNRFRC